MKPCRICGRPDDRIQIRTGSGICCNLCEKIEKGELNGEKALDYLWPLTSTYSNARSTFGLIKSIVMEGENA